MEKARARIPLMLLAVGLLAMPLVPALSATPDAAAVEARLQDAVTRLKLTPEQQAQLRPLIEERNQKLKAIRDKNGERTSRSAKRNMLREARPVQVDYENKVRAILNETQQAEWEKMRKEARDRLALAINNGGLPDY